MESGGEFPQISQISDGTRPVIFKIERIDIPESPEDETYLRTHDFHHGPSDAYTG